MKKLLVLRPEPGAAQTIAAARALGLDAIGAPIFETQAVAWEVPPGPFDALMLTSANAVRFALNPPPGGGGYGNVRTLPVYAVGEATAAAARAAGLDVVHVGAGGAVALAAAMRAEGVRHALHLTGEVHRAVPDPGFGITRVIVYRSAPIEHLSVAPEGTVALIHSPDAGCLFARLVDRTGALRSRIAVAAISAAAAERMGEGWQAVAIAPHPTDAALLAVAAKLCEEAALDRDGRA